jgi:Dyp-type peroxidase family
MRPFVLNDIQGNVVRGYDLPHACYLHATLPDSPTEAAALLRQLLTHVTTAEDQAEAPAGRDATVNLAFTSTGLERFGLTSREVASWFPADFVQGMACRSGPVLGDAGDNVPDRWEWQGFQPHLLITVHAPDPSMLDATVQELSACATFAGVPPNVQYASTIESKRGRSRREHFGFADGISQPPLDTGSPLESNAIGGLPIAGGGWAPVPAGEFILGLPDLDEDEPELPCPGLMHNGTYLVYRKIEQDVRAFRDWVSSAAASDAGRMIDANQREAAKIIAAKLVGRHKDGSPLVPPASPEGSPPSNNFRYQDDPYGVQCPLGSHIRRANPRDALGFDGALVNRHRLIRRGMPYGTPYEDGAADTDRGLIFIAYCGSIARQFEFIQREWLNDGDVLGIGHNTDPIAGTSAGAERFLVPHETRSVLFDIRANRSTQFVHVRWGEYFFQPGLAGLAWLCDRGDEVSRHGSGSGSRASRGTSRTPTAPGPASYDPGGTG